MWTSQVIRPSVSSASVAIWSLTVAISRRAVSSGVVGRLLVSSRNFSQNDLTALVNSRLRPMVWVSRVS